MGYIRQTINFKMMRNLLFFLGIIIITFIILFKDQNMGDLHQVLMSVDTKFVIFGVCLMIVYYLIESYNIKAILKTLGNEISIFSALRYTFIGFFFSAITPAATGGQPVEVYYMNKDKISAGDATMTLLLQLCGFQISTITLGIISAIINPAILSGGLVWFFVLGLILNGFALSLMLICIFSKKATEKLVNTSMKILSFFKAKHLDIRKRNILEAMEKYKGGSEFIKSHMMVFVRAVLRVFVQIIVFYSVTYCTFRAFGLDTYTYLQILPMQAILYTIVSGIPLPGAVGVSETAFVTIFGEVFGRGIVKSAMLLNRGVTFYWFVIISLIVVIVTARKKKDVKGEIDEKAFEFEEEVRRLNTSNIVI